MPPDKSTYTNIYIYMTLIYLSNYIFCWLSNHICDECVDVFREIVSPISLDRIRPVARLSGSSFFGETHTEMCPLFQSKYSYKDKECLLSSINNKEG